MSELTRADIENFRYYAGGDLADRICTLALQAHSSEKRAESAEAEAARLRQEVIDLRGYVQAMAEESDQHDQHLQALKENALQSAPPASGECGGERCRNCGGHGKTRFPDASESVTCARCGGSGKDTTRATTGGRYFRNCRETHPVPRHLNDPAPADRPEPSEALQKLTYAAWAGGGMDAEEVNPLHAEVRLALSQPVPAVPDAVRQLADEMREQAERESQLQSPAGIFQYFSRRIDEALAAAPTPEGGTHD